VGLRHDARAPGQTRLGLPLRLLRPRALPRFLPAVPLGRRRARRYPRQRARPLRRDVHVGDAGEPPSRRPTKAAARSIRRICSTRRSSSSFALTEMSRSSSITPRSCRTGRPRCRRCTRAFAMHRGLSQWEKEYASMVLRLDDIVGMIYALLEELGILDRTVIIFASDNGHEPSYYTEEGRCTGGKKSQDGRAIDHIDLNYTVRTGRRRVQRQRRAERQEDVQPRRRRADSRSSSATRTIPQAGTVSSTCWPTTTPWRRWPTCSASTLPEWKDGLVVPAGTEGRARSRRTITSCSPAASAPRWSRPRAGRCATCPAFVASSLFYLPDDYREEKNLADAGTRAAEAPNPMSSSS
jgi:hypothetical protein